MDNRTLESYVPGLPLLRQFAAEEIAEISTSQRQVEAKGIPDSEWFKHAEICDVTCTVLWGIASSVIYFNFDCLHLTDCHYFEFCEQMQEILSDNQVLCDVVEEMVEAERVKLAEEEKQNTKEPAEEPAY